MAKKHLTAGGVLYDPKTKKVYLTHKISRDEWLLPKGHVETRETIPQAARREVQEETGYQDLSRPTDADFLDMAEFTFVGADGEMQFKEIHNYLIILQSDEFVMTPERAAEGLDGEWFTIDEAIRKASKENIKKTLNLVKNIVT